MKTTTNPIDFINSAMSHFDKQLDNNKVQEYDISDDIYFDDYCDLDLLLNQSELSQNTKKEIENIMSQIECSSPYIRVKKNDNIYNMYFYALSENETESKQVFIGYCFKSQLNRFLTRIGAK